jgi:hypothetical protein
MAAKFKFDLTKIVQLLPIIFAGVDEAQDLFAAPPNETPDEKAARNKQKKGHVMNLVALSVSGTNTAAGKILIDPVKAAIAADNLIDGVVAAANVKPKAAVIVVGNPPVANQLQV